MHPYLTRTVHITRICRQRKSKNHLKPLSLNNTIPHQPKYSSKQANNRWTDSEPAATYVARRRDHNPPRIFRQTRAIDEALVNPPNLPQPIHSSVNQPDSSSIHPPQRALNSSPTSNRSPYPQSTMYGHQARRKNTQKAQKSTQNPRVPAVDRSKRAQIDSEVEVRPRKPLD